MFDPDFSDPPLFLLSPIHLLILQSSGVTLHMFSLVCIVGEAFLFGRVHVISKGPINTVQTKAESKKINQCSAGH
ncbi:unnamed protein product [Staurois parvus]|uniref:Uncharacterized protein n=1 Tax=Staurois parvus TaxID=386267 RepID=A0ABN9FRI0_9NEOB|nr:unnamed protein product [Staurois parvus]